MTKATQTNVETQIINAKEQIARIESIASEFKPEYKDVGSRLKASWTS